MKIVQEQVTVATTGSAGSASGSGQTSHHDGYLLAVNLDFSASAPNTTDTTIAYKNVGGTILAVANSATDVMAAPRMKCVDNANAAITNSFDYFPINQPLTIALAQCDAVTAAVVATFFFLEM